MCIESIDYMLAWAADYCEATGITTPCTGIEDRAVELCLEKRDCHPGLLVPFENDVQAFFSGGIYNEDAMTVVAVWRGESDPSVARYGGAQRLLEAFLSTMQVWPASTPLRSEPLELRSTDVPRPGSGEPSAGLTRWWGPTSPCGPGPGVVVRCAV